MPFSDTLGKARNESGGGAGDKGASAGAATTTVADLVERQEEKRIPYLIQGRRRRKASVQFYCFRDVNVYGKPRVSSFQAIFFCPILSRTT